MTNLRGQTPAARTAESARQERSQGCQPHLSESGDPVVNAAGPASHPENQKGAAQATEDNDLSTGHSAPDDGGADNAQR
jgi:hypothetical protein